MKNLLLPEINQFRIEHPLITPDMNKARNGAFILHSQVDGIQIGVLASVGGGWDHVSVSRPDRIPWWYEMEFVKRLFFEDHETAMQLHVPPSDHVNNHPNVLHLWRPRLLKIPRPPKEFV